MPGNHGCGREVAGSHSVFRITLALDTYLQTAEVVEHDYLAGKEGTGDEGLHGAEHGQRIGLSDGGAVVDVLGEVLKRVVTRLDGLGVEVGGTFDSVLTGILAFGY